MSLSKSAAALSALLLLSCSRHHGPPAISVSGAWARATVAGQSAGAVYFTLRNGGDGDDTLLAVATPVGQASVHSTTMTGGVMRMRPVDSLAIPAHSTVALKPGGYHVMIMGLKQPLRAGSNFPLSLSFDRSGNRTVTVTVRPATTIGDSM